MSQKVEVSSDSVFINGQEYVKKGADNVPVVNTEGLPYVLVRTYSAGVHAGYLKSRNGREVELLNSRRIWYWAGAATLSQLAQSGTSKPNECEFPEEVSRIILLDGLEILDVTSAAKATIDAVKVWKA